jgi:hypothetical protein
MTAGIPWNIWWQRRLFLTRSISHIADRAVRKDIQVEMNRILAAGDSDGTGCNPDPRFTLRVHPRDLADGRLGEILRRLSGVTYLKDLRFADGLEKTLIAYHQHSGRDFAWRSPPRPVSAHIEYIDDNVGFGVFADRDLVPGEFVGEYTGVVRLRDTIVNGTYAYAYPPVATEEGELLLSIDAGSSGNITRFINHDPDESVLHEYDYFNGHWHVIYTVSRPISRGEQMCINYGDGYWKARQDPPRELPKER